MLLSDELNNTYEKLIRGELNSVHTSLLEEVEKTFYADENLYIKKYLGVLYFFSNQYLLAYEFLKDEKDDVSKFFLIYSLIKLRYIRQAKEKYFEFKNPKLLKNYKIKYEFLVEVAFLLGLDIVFPMESRDVLSNCLIKLMNNFKYNSKKTEVSSYVFMNGSRAIVHELNNRINEENTKCDNFEIFKHNYNVSDDAFFEIYSYSEFIGNNMYLLKIGGNSVIVDCGSDVKNTPINFDEFFHRARVVKNDIKAIFFTHAHFDHVGHALNLLDYLNKKVPYYISKVTRDLTCQSHEILLEGIDIEINKTIEITDDLNVTFINCGHILGATSLLFACHNKKILFTSDFCLHDQTTVSGMDLSQANYFIKDELDYLITESTYGSEKTDIEYDGKVELFKSLISKFTKYNKKVFLPCYSIGRGQEIYNFLMSEEKTRNLRINMIGKVFNVSLYYQNLGFCNVKKCFNDHTNKFSYDILLASSGTLIENSESFNTMLELLENNKKDFAIIETGYIPMYEEGYYLIKERKQKQHIYFDIGLSAHASNNELRQLINYFHPKKIISIHGDGIK